ncbi:MAG: hypothetical protein M1820_009393 [Bogoriella megaspora]|nr:MAG: hypothetical protein M1820_009393 [Bogoriella megaspora]
MASASHWQYAVPVNGENYELDSSKPRSYDDPQINPSSAIRKPLGSQMNGNFRSNVRRNDNADRRNYGKDSGNQLAPRQMLGRMNSDRSGVSDGDSLLELYNNTGNTRKGTSSGQNSRKHSLGDRHDEEELDGSAWIHRDKLAKIESRELEEAGFRVGRHTTNGRSSSRSTSRRGRGSDQYGEDANSDGVSPHEAPLRGDQRRLPSPIPAEEEPADFDEALDFDLRSAEEVVPERTPFVQREAPSVRPGTSRIPLPKNSPAPLPSSFIERDSPLPRSRNNSNAWSNGPEDNISFKYTRRRSHSVGSQVMLDDFGSSREDQSALPSSPIAVPNLSKQSSPSKAKTPNKATPTSGARKNTGNRTASAQQKKRTGSTPSRELAGQRPSSSGNPIRPSTSHKRPEGEAPWIATMYKPDPRLPPEQQMLPTHAKRMMQEQWEKEGKIGKSYDRDFRLVDPHEFPEPRSSSPYNSQQDTQSGAESDEPRERTWPLEPPRLNTNNHEQRPGTGGTEHGGYKITPTVQSPQLSPNGQQRPITGGPIPQTRPPDPIHIPEPPEEKEDKKKGSCACCIVM